MTFLVQSESQGTVETILKLSEAPATIIAMVSQTSAIESALLGSATRQVIRRSTCPVWVVHPNPQKNLNERTPHEDPQQK